jgi:hemolysin activation/secretion protein
LRATVWAFLLVIAAWVVIAGPSAAQQGVRPGDERIEAPPLQTPAPPPELALPPPPPQSPEEKRRLSGGIKGFVQRIVVEGSTVFSPEELSVLVAPFEGRTLGSEELYRARDAVSQFYHDHGYITSGAVLPDQEVEQGVVVLRVIEGQLAEVEIEGTDRFLDEYFRSRLRWAGRTPVSIVRIESVLQLLQQQPLIDRVSARLVPGERRGESRLELTVDEALPAELELTASNYRSPSIGEFVGEVDTALANMIGVADELSANFEVAEGLYDVDMAYSIPVNRFDTVLAANFRESRGKVVLDEFSSLDIRSKLRTFGVSIEQPLIREVGRDLSIGLIGEIRKSETDLRGLQFCSIAGKPIAGPGGSTPVVDAPDCHPRVVALRFFQQYQTSGQESAIALRSMFTFGLDTLGATANNNSVADGDFVAWLGQLQYVHRLPPAFLDSHVVARIDAQLASDPLLSIEKFSIGGARTVRGYRENQLVRDNGIALSVEVRIPIISGSRGPLRLSLVPFVDAGRGWDESGPAKLETDILASVGVGLAFRLFEGISGEMQYGRRLTGASGENGNGLQQYGVSFRVTIDALAPWR